MNPLPSKYAYLQQAGRAGLSIPATWLLTSTELPPIPSPSPARGEGGKRGMVAQRFIVRSAVVAEDGLLQSLAGHFWSSGAVTWEALPATIALAWAENTAIVARLGLATSPMVMVQHYIEHRIGGVLFTPWGFFDAYAQLEYAETGVREVVEGRSQPAIISLDGAYPAPLPLPDRLAWLEQPLRVMALQLRESFPFPLDCEWAYCTQTERLVVLQVRPQTRLSGAVKSLPQGHQPVLPAGQWTYTALSESLGKISPLSFSLLQQLYTDSLTTLRWLGCKAAQADFLLHLPDGTVLVDTARERAFFQTTVLGGFWRGFRAPTLQKTLRQYLAQGETAAAFDYTRLTHLFRYWLAHNLLTHGAGREQPLPAHAYELTWNAPLPPVAACDVRQAFFGEWCKLKQQLAEERRQGIAFYSWQEYVQGESPEAHARQHTLASAAVYDYSSSGTAGGEDFRSLAARQVVTGTALVVQSPPRFRGEISAGCILIAPYFDNRWVAQLERVAAVVVMQGGALSHAALVARELGIPYCVVGEALLQGINTGDLLRLDPVKRVLSVA